VDALSLLSLFDARNIPFQALISRRPQGCRPPDTRKGWLKMRFARFLAIPCFAF
jgi:hypothetical protein